MGDDTATSGAGEGVVMSGLVDIGEMETSRSLCCRNCDLLSLYGFSPAKVLERALVCRKLKS